MDLIIEVMYLDLEEIKNAIAQQNE